MTYARDEAIRLVQWALADLSEGESICLEMPFLSVKRKADLAIVSNERLSAIEIKGARDNVQRLSMQLLDYHEMFLDVTVAVAPKHLDRVREEAPRSVGIVLLGPSKVESLRKPLRRTRLSAAAASRWLTKHDLSKLMGHTAARLNTAEELRALAEKRFTSRFLTDAALAAISSRNEARYAAFQRERGAQINLDDLLMLSLQQSIRR
jgi:hypothetical protein